MNLRNTLKPSTVAFQSLWLICSFLLVVNPQPTHAKDEDEDAPETDDEK